MDTIDLRHLFEARIEIGAPFPVGEVYSGFTRRVFPVTGGSFVGDRLKGTILSSGEDAMIVRPGGSTTLDVRLLLKTEADEIIYMTYKGRFVRGGDTEYFRIAAEFETSAPALRWLNDIIAIGRGSRRPSGPVYDVYEVL